MYESEYIIERIWCSYAWSIAANMSVCQLWEKEQGAEMVMFSFRAAQWSMESLC